MALVKLMAIGLFFYALTSSKYYIIVWALILWEIGGGFALSTVLWFSNISKDDHDSR